ncbi:hypothetical protein H1R20_g10858, partial [Candolleomyces eurysporus]
MYTTTASLTEHRDTVNCLTFSDDGLYLASGDDSGIVLVCKTQDPSQFDRYYFTDSVTSLLWIPGTKSLYAGLANCEVHYLSLEDERVYQMDFRPVGYEEMSPALQQLNQISCLAFDPVHSWIAIGVGVMTIVISIRDFTKNKYTELCTITPGRSNNRQLTHGQSPKALSAEVRSLHFTPSGRQIIVTTLEEGIRCFGIRDLTEKWRIGSHSYRIGRSALNIKGTLIVCSNLFDGFDLYDIETRSYICTLPQTSPEHINVPLPVLFVHDNQEILIGSAHGKVQIRPIAENGGDTCVLDHASDIIQAIAYGQIASNSYIATACSEKGSNTYVKLWVRSPMAKQVLQHPGVYSYREVSPLSQSLPKYAEGPFHGRGPLLKDLAVRG